MNPAYQKNGTIVYQGGCLDILKAMPEQSVQCCVTSPPYWGLRDYGVDGQLGLEKTPEEYTERMVEIFREVRRVLRDDGTLWLNLGDSYATGTTTDRQPSTGVLKHHVAQDIKRVGTPTGLKTKDLVGIPWRVAFALQADGWYLRSDIIWNKPNPMPESVTDRPTKSHEYIFLMSKNKKYYYDADAIKEEATYPDGANSPESIKSPYGQGFTRNAKHNFKRQNSKRGESICPKSPTPTHRPDRKDNDYDTKFRNKRSVWTISTQPFPQAHFAVFPEALPEICIKAGCPEGGTVLDPFVGAGTTLKIARDLGCHGIGIELNPEYIEIIKGRLEQQVLDFV